MGLSGGLLAEQPNWALVMTDSRRFVPDGHGAPSLTRMLPARQIREHRGLGLREALAALLHLRWVRRPARVVRGPASRANDHPRAPSIASELTTAAMILPVLARESDRSEPKA